MLPRWHVLLGAIFTLVLWFFSPGIKLLYLTLTFLSSVLIDFDHYVTAAYKKKNLSLKCSYEYYEEVERQHQKDRKKGIRKSYDFHLFHTVEFHLLVALLSFFWVGFFYILIGMFFHSLCDFIYIAREDALYRREYFFFKWLAKKFL